MFPGIGALPEPATESHVVNSSPLSAKGPEKKSHPRGKPLQSSFPKYHELFGEPHHCKAADNSLSKHLGLFPVRNLSTSDINWVVSDRGPPHLMMSDLLIRVVFT